MLKNINHFIFPLLFLLAGLGQGIQAQTLVFNVGSDTVDIDSMVVIPIRVDSFQTISGYQGTIRFDTAALEFMALSSPQSGVNNIFGNPGQGLIPLDAATFSWIDFSGGNVTLPDSTAIINISFQVKSTAVGGDYTVSIDGSVTSLLFTQGVGVVPALANAGTVRVNPCVSSSDASFSFLSSACVNGFNPQALIFGDLGGTFAVDNGASIDPITGILDLSSTMAGTTYNVTYTVGAPCAAVDTQSIQIFAAEDASFSIPDTTCLSETNLLPDLAGYTRRYILCRQWSYYRSRYRKLGSKQHFCQYSLHHYVPDSRQLSGCEFASGIHFRYDGCFLCLSHRYLPRDC